LSLVGNGTYVFVLATGSNGLVYLDQATLLTGNSGFAYVGWQSLGIATAVAPAAASSGNRTAAVVISPDGRIMYDWWDLGGGGHGFLEVPGGGRTNAAAAVALVANGTYMFIVVKGLDNQLWLNQGTPGGAFVGWAPLGIATNVAPGAIASGNRSALLVTTPDGRIAYDWWDLGGGLHGLRYLPPLEAAQVSPAAGFVDNGATLIPLATTTGNLGPYLYRSSGAPGGSFAPWQFDL
jgi:hypothetical protein